MKLNRYNMYSCQFLRLALLAACNNDDDMMDPHGNGHL